MARVLLSFLLLLGLSCHCGAKLSRAPHRIMPSPPRILRAPHRLAPHASASQQEAGAARPGKGQVYWPGLNGGAWASKLEYHGGALMTQPITVYLIYYGHWAPDAGQFILEGFINSLSSTAADNQGASVRRWWETVTRYTDRRGRHVASEVTYGGAISVHEAPGSYRTHLGDGDSGVDDIWPIVEEAIRRNNFPLDSNALYTVITSKDVHVGSAMGGFCKAYGGWHNQNSDAFPGTPVRYVLMGDPTLQCPQWFGLGSVVSTTANGFPSVDTMISTFAHELAESATNPDTQTGFWAANLTTGEYAGEDGDICAWVYTDRAHPRPLMDSAETYQYNMVGVKGLKFLVQTIPDVDTQSCVLQAPPVTPPPASGGDVMVSCKASGSWIDGTGVPTAQFSCDVTTTGPDALTSVVLDCRALTSSQYWNIIPNKDDGTCALPSWAKLGPGSSPTFGFVQRTTPAPVFRVLSYSGASAPPAGATSPPAGAMSPPAGSSPPPAGAPPAASLEVSTIAALTIPIAIPPIAVYNVTLRNAGSTPITALTLTATNLSPVYAWGLVASPNAPQGTLTLAPEAFPIAPGQVLSQLGYIQLESSGPASFTVDSVSN